MVVFRYRAGKFPQRICIANSQLAFAQDKNLIRSVTKRRILNGCYNTDPATVHHWYTDFLINTKLTSKHLSYMTMSSQVG